MISYRPKMAVRDAAKALGHSPGQQDAWSKQIDGWTVGRRRPGRRRRARDPGARGRALADQLIGAPRHLGIHSGGMVLTERPIGEVCPIERARMDRRTSCSGTRTPASAMGLVKFDLLGLGMLGALDHMMVLVGRRSSASSWTLADDAQGGARRLRHALPGRLGRRLPGREPRPDRHPAAAAPARFYDLAIEIALIRPGPIQGGAVHPYIRRATGREPVTYAHPDLEPVLRAHAAAYPSSRSS